MDKWIRSGNKTGGICQECADNTTGDNCEKCNPKFYRDPTRPLEDPYVCIGKLERIT